MAWMRDLALFGLVFCSSLVPTRASLDSHSHGDFLLPQVAEYGSRDLDVEHYAPGKRAHLEQREEKCDLSVDNQRKVAYYESWASRRECNTFQPSDINASRWTHINIAFAVLDWVGKITPASKEDEEIYNKAMALKDENEDLQIWIAVGGKTMGSRRFSNMASSRRSREKFIQSAKEFMDAHGFDGIDIDWEYPAATHMGGQRRDTENLTKLVKEMREAFGDKKGISVAVPAGHYLKGFDLKSMQSDLDMINFMSYDLHGAWETPLLALPGTNLTEIEDALQNLGDKGVSMKKVNLGLAYYGYAYILEDKSCSKPGCPAFAPIGTGPCGKTAGTLEVAEVQHIIANNTIDPTLSPEAAIMHFTWDENNWAAYDNNETLQMKTAFARDNCLGGSFVWAVDMQNPENELAPWAVKRKNPQESGGENGEESSPEESSPEEPATKANANAGSPSKMLSQGFMAGSFICIFFILSVI
ncbi:chitinase [Aspergillus sp. HF37]|nr:chitinase [Aspergillus sp. HF37]